MLLILVAVSAVVPSLLLIWYFHSRDVNPEPGKFVWSTFGLGVSTVIPVLIFGLPFSLLFEPIREPFTLGALEAFITAAIPEETFKLSVLLLYCYNHKDFDEPMDGIVHGAIASLGFATFENVIYVMKGGFGAAVLRAFTAVPNHAFLGAIMGYFVGQSKLYPAKRWSLIGLGLGSAVLLHGLYDFPILSMANFEKLGFGKPQPGVVAPLLVVTIAALTVEWAWAIRLTRRLRKEQLEIAAEQAMFGSVWGHSDSVPPSMPPSMPSPRLSGIVSVRPPSSVPRIIPIPSVGSQVAAWLMVIPGGLLASLGGLVTLTVIGSLIFSPADAPSTQSLLLGGAFLGGLPLIAGLALFAAGISKMKDARPVLPRQTAEPPSIEYQRAA